MEPRNTPTIFLADFNFDNFWDGRARHDDNGGSVFGPTDPQSHVFVSAGGNLVPTRQIIKFSSLASLAKGPVLSKFEMSFELRNWAKIGKKLLQAGVTPLANQLVDPTDSILGPYSSQGGSACASLPVGERSGSYSNPPVNVLNSGKPGLCISYRGLIRHAFYPALHNNTTAHFNGCFTDGRSEIHPNQCAPGSVAIPVLSGGSVVNSSADPFDNYVLTPASGAASTTDTNQFTHMEGNFSLFFGQSIHIWATILVPDDTPWDQWLDENPDGSEGIGEVGEPLLVNDLPTCGDPGSGTSASVHRHCFSPLGNFQRDPGLTACIASALVPGVGRVCTNRIPATGTRAPGDPDPLLGMDLFFGSNVSLKNTEFRAARCGECHAPPTLTDHTVAFTHAWTLGDVLPELDFGTPDVEPLLEPLGRDRNITGFLLEDETNAPGQDAIERIALNMSIAPAPVSTNVNCTVDSCSGYSFPDAITNDGQGGYIIHSDIGDVTQGPLVGDNTPVPFTSFGGAFVDNGVYNLGVTQCEANQSEVTGRCDDNGRGNTDPFGWPLSFAALLMKNLGGTDQEPGVPIAWDLTVDPLGGLFEESGQDQQINPGHEDEVADPLLPAYLYPFVNKITVGDEHPELDEAGGPVGGMVNTLMDSANAEGFVQVPFDPQGYINEVLNSAVATGDGTLGGPGEAHMGTWPVVNRVGRFGSIKAPQLREVELTGPYFHNGGKLTLRQVVDFYVRGGDYPVVNAEHRDFLMLNLNADLQANLDENEKVALVDFMLELTDHRVLFERAPFDRPQMILPLDGTAPEPSATFNRDDMLAGCTDTTPPNKFGPGQQACAGGMFLNAPASGAAGIADPLPNFLNISSGPRLVGAAANCGAAADNQYCH